MQTGESFCSALRCGAFGAALAPADRLKIEAALEARVGAPHRVASGGRGLTSCPRAQPVGRLSQATPALTWNMRPSSRCEPVGQRTSALPGAGLPAPALRSFRPLPSACALRLRAISKRGGAAPNGGVFPEPPQGDLEILRSESPIIIGAWTSTEPQGGCTMPGSGRGYRAWHTRS